MAKTFSTICIVIVFVLLAGCRHPGVESVMPECFTDQRIVAIPPWLLDQARHEKEGTFNLALKPKGFALDPRMAAFIYGNLFHTTFEWRDFPDVRLFKTKDYYLCVAATQDTCKTIDDILADPTSVVLRGVDGRVFDKKCLKWNRVGYVNESQASVRNRIKGKSIGEVIDCVGVPYSAWGYTSKLTLSWEIVLTPKGLMIESQPVTDKMFLEKINLSVESVIDYWCQDGNLSLRFLKGLYQEQECK